MWTGKELKETIHENREDIRKQACGEMFRSACNLRSAHSNDVVASYTRHLWGISEITRYDNTVAEPVPAHSIGSHIRWHHLLVIHLGNRLEMSQCIPFP